jgi:uncharacterized membrane protein YgcG
MAFKLQRALAKLASTSRAYFLDAARRRQRSHTLRAVKPTTTPTTTAAVPSTVQYAAVYICTTESASMIEGREGGSGDMGGGRGGEGSGGGGEGAWKAVHWRVGSETARTSRERVEES